MTNSSSRIRSALSALTRLSPGEWVVLVQAMVAIPIVTLMLKRRGLQRTQRFLTRLSGRAPKPTQGAEEAQRWSRMVGIAGAYGIYRPNCLQRSLVLWTILRRRRFDPDLRIGVAPPNDGEGLRFHAWIEVGEEVVNDRPDIAAEFRPFADPVDASLGAFDR